MNKNEIYAFRIHGWMGLLIMSLAEILLITNSTFVKSWFTPIMWTGYILFIDAFIYRVTGNSLISGRFKQFLFMLPYSVGCWLIFEAYNLHLQNWQYIGLPENIVERYFGYFWAFATIFPGVLLTSEAIDILGIFNKLRVRTFTFRKTTLYIIITIGGLFLLVPVLVPQKVAAYLFGLVWIGFVFFLDPINYFSGGKSLFRDLENGRLNKLFSLFLAGAICGFLWEFWNYWATAKWIYTLPFLNEPKIFEMPLIGFLGFLPFAIEIYVMWEFAARVLKFDSHKN